MSIMNRSQVGNHIGPQMNQAHWLTQGNYDGVWLIHIALYSHTILQPP